MCLIAIAYRVNPRYPLIVLANRDEYYARPTAPMAEWKDHPGLFAGRDLHSGGTWMGMTRSGRFAAVTNYREVPAREYENSRGHLVTGYLTGAMSSEAYLQQLGANAQNYAGFSLLLADCEHLCFFSNREHIIRKLPPGIYGLSNHLLDTPWPKVVRLKQAIESCLDKPEPNGLMAPLASTQPASDEKLPSTGVGVELERRLSPCFIESRDYGTRSSHLVMIDERHEVLMHERSYGPEGRFLGERVARFSIDPG